MNKVACVHVTNNHRKYRVDSKKITAIAAEISRRLGIAHYEICILFTTPKAMRTLNFQYRQKDKSTDVLSFPQYTWKKPLKVQLTPPAAQPVLNPLPLGDVVISIDDAHQNAKDSKHELAKEICFLMIHGILHLVGHDHMKPDEKKLMFGEQKKLLSLFSKASSNNSISSLPTWKDCVKEKATNSKKSTSAKKPNSSNISARAKSAKKTPAKKAAKKLVKRK